MEQGEEEEGGMIAKATDYPMSPAAEGQRQRVYMAVAAAAAVAPAVPVPSR